MINTNHNIGASRNQGAILVSMMLMVLLVSFIAVTSISTITTNQRVVANSIRDMQAFEAAESGLEYGIMYGKDNINSLTTDSDNDGSINYTIPVSPGSHYTVTYNNPISNNFDLLGITSVGTSDDGTVTKTVYQQLYNSNFLTVSPPAGLTTLGSVSLSGNVDVMNEGGTAIWSGGGVTLGNAVSVDGAIVNNDTTLSSFTPDQFFNNFFNKTKATAKNSANIIYNNTTDTNYSAPYTSPNGLDGVLGKVIYITQAAGTTATINSNAVIGSANNPVILIVDGDFKFNGNATLYGVLYVIGNWGNSGGGSAAINGAAIVEGDMSSTGTPALNFSQNLQNLNTITSLVKIPGTWRDF